MSAFAETQHLVRQAVVRGDTEAVRPLLVGGRDPAQRLALHQRHYRASLVRTLLDRFPAVAWLVGSEAMTSGAVAYVADHPPRTPSLSEFGQPFPAYLAKRLGSATLDYLPAFGELEWHVGTVSIAVDVPPLTIESIAAATAGDDATLALQPGVRYVHAAWPIHELMRFFLTESAPDRYEMRREDAWIEVRGARGAFDIQSLGQAAWRFRRELQAGKSIGRAAAIAADVDAAFAAGDALGQVIAAGLVAAVHSVP